MPVPVSGPAKQFAPRTGKTAGEKFICWYCAAIRCLGTLCPDVTVITDSDKAMSAVEINGQRIYITEAEADALTVAGAVDGRKHLKATDSDSVI